MLKKAAVGLVVLLAILLSVVWVVEFDATEIGRAALGRASASSGLRLEASRYRLNLLRGLTIEDVEARALVPGVRYRVVVPLMRLEHRLTSLVRGPLEIERVVLVEPRVAIVTGLTADPPESPPPRPRASAPRPPPERSPSPEPAASLVELRVRELELVGAAIAFNDELSLEDVDVLLSSPTLDSGAVTLLHAIDASGRLAVGALSFRSLTVHDIVVENLSLAGGRLGLAGGAFELERGSFRADVQIDVNSIPARHRMTLEGRLDGVPGRVYLEGEGFGLDAENLKGSGRWDLPAGRFDDAPLWRSLELTGEAYEATEIAIELARARVSLDGVWIRGEIGLDGALDLVVSGREVRGTWDAPVVR